MSEDDRRAAAAEHLRAAALEMIEAARAFLDVAEEVVADPEVGRDLLDTVSDLAGAAAARLRPDPHAGAPPAASTTDPERDDPPGRVRRITVT